MRIGIPTTGSSGLDAMLSRHFGRAPFFTLVDEGTGQLAVLANDGAEHEPGCAATGLVAREGVTAVVCQQLGRGAFMRLRELGVRVYLTEAETVQGALAEWRAGGLAELELGQIQRGRYHDCRDHQPDQQDH